ncbi:hypothetical protein ACFLR1_06820, partial [Bacteroidota bacterium]
ITNISSIATVRQVVDDLLKDIWEEIEAACARFIHKNSENVAAEYGLGFMAMQNSNHYYTRRVA